jgi:hypothetical protein
MPGLSRPWPTLSSTCYDIVFRMPLFSLLPSGKRAMLSRWYKITVHGDGSQKVDGEELQISPFWIGNHLQDCSTN